ncbi:MAG: hypothetical protein KDK48_05725, partial [Chlamydiia bacterium]|nr:hypothetical protein [Chlamydiia bacterium]
FQVSATYSAASFVICGIALAILGRENLPICDLMGFTGGVATTATLLAMSWQPIGWMAGCIALTHLAIAILVEATRPNEYKTA